MVGRGETLSVSVRVAQAGVLPPEAYIEAMSAVGPSHGGPGQGLPT